MTRATLAVLALEVVAVCLPPALGAQDTIRLRADGPPAWGTVRLIKEAAMGSLDDPVESGSGVITQVASMPNGMFFVYDPRDTVIRRYDAGAKFLGTVGRSGGGPGEYRMVSGMGIANDSTLVVWDGGNSRVSRFSAAGIYLGGFTIAKGNVTLSDGGPLFVESTGMIRIQAAMLDPAVQTGPPQIIRMWIRYRVDGRVVDSIPIPRVESAGFSLSTTDGLRQNFDDAPVSVPFARGGTLTGWPRPYRFTIPRDDGKVLLVERPYQPIPIAGEERREWLAHAERFNNPPPPPPWSVPVAGPRRTYTIPNSKPGFRDIRSDPLGRVWAEAYINAEKRDVTRPAGSTAPPLTWRERATFDVFDADGKYLARVELPAEHILMSVQRNKVWLRSKGADGEDIISIYRIDGT